MAFIRRSTSKATDTVKETVQVQRIESDAALKALSEPLRLSILQYLMEQPATLSQLGRLHEAHPAKIRYHLKLLEKAGLVMLESTKVVGGFVEKYYRASAKAYTISRFIMPKSSFEQSIVFMGSHDLAISLLAERIQRSPRPVELQSLYVGSLYGLVALQQGLCQLAGSHLRDSTDDQFNLEAVRTLFPGRKMVMVTLAEREQGLITRPGNPLRFKGVDDLTRADARLVNRQPGSGTRVWLDRSLNDRHIDASQIQGYGQVVSSHLLVAQAVASGEADIGLGLLAAARTLDLEFLPMFQERYDLIMDQTAVEDPTVIKIIEQLNSASFRAQIRALGGYDTTHTGEIHEIGF